MSKKLSEADPRKKAREFRVSANEKFAITDGGVSHVVKDKEGEKIVSPLTMSKFEIIGFLEPLDDVAGRGLHIDLGDRKVTVERADMAKRDQLATWLSAHGVRYNPDGVGKLLKYVAMWNGDPITAYTRAGRQKNRAFVLGETVINGDGVALMPHANMQYETRGTYQEWRDEVLTRAQQKPGWVLGILLGLSSPILDRVNAPNGSFFNITGQSRTGKTYSLMAGAGCWGSPTKGGCLRSFNTTINAAEGLASEASDIGLFLDELSKATDARKGMVQEIIYMLANGQGKNRMTSNASLRSTATWLCNIVVSSEKTIEGLFDAVGQQQAAGQVIRAFDLDGTRLLPQVSLDAVRDFDVTLKLYYGTAGRELVRRLIECDDIDARFTRALTRLYDGEDGLLQSAAGAFASAIVAGELMDIDTAVVDDAFAHWMTEGVDDALDDCFQCAERMLDFIEAKKGVTLRTLATGDDQFDGDDEGGEIGFSSRDRDGWYDKDEDAVYFRSAVARKFADGISSIRFYEWLVSRDVMEQPPTWRDGKNEKRRFTTRVPGVKDWGVRIDVAKLRAQTGRGDD